MSKIVAVVGATGGQGGSVVRALLKHGEYKVRGITRNVNSDKAKALSSQGVEVVTADLNDEASLTKAFEGATAIFAVTDFFEPFAKNGPDVAFEVEYKQGVNIVNAALGTPTLQHFIWSTLPSSKKISGGKFVVPHMESKARIDDYIKAKPELLAKTTFLWITFYSINFFYPVFQPFFLKSIGTYVFIQPVAPSTLISAAGDISVNVGIFARAILSNPSKTRGGKYVFCNLQTYKSDDYLQLWAKVTGKQRAHYLQVSFEDYQKLFPAWGAEMGIMMLFWEYAGEKSWSGEELITGSDLGVHGELMTMEKSFMASDWSFLD